MNVNVHYPTSTDGINKLNDVMSTVHAELIVNYITNLNCSLDEKKELLHHAKYGFIAKKNYQTPQS